MPSCRLEKTINKFDVIDRNQIGFLKVHRTSDHGFVLDTLVNKVVKQRGKSFFTAFIDLRKAYDSVDRNFLFRKLWALGLEGNFLESFRSIYHSVYQCVKIQDELIEPIVSERGLKQGCNLSPLLFNLFVEDIRLILDNSCDQVSLDKSSFNHLLYADDLVLFAATPNGLQIVSIRLTLSPQIENENQ